MYTKVTLITLFVHIGTPFVDKGFDMIVAEKKPAIH